MHVRYWVKSVNREGEISYDTPYMRNLKQMIQMNLLTKQNKTHRLRKRTYGCGGAGGTMSERDNKGVWDRHIHTAIFKMDNQ